MYNPVLLYEMKRSKGFFVGVYSNNLLLLAMGGEVVETYAGNLYIIAAVGSC